MISYSQNSTARAFHIHVRDTLFCGSLTHPDFVQINHLLKDVAPLYPNFSSWLNFKFRRNMASGEREIIAAHNGDELLGLALLKNNSEEKKICTFFVNEDYRAQGIGKQLMSSAVQHLDNSDTLITVSSERVSELAPLLGSQGFALSNSIASLYRPESVEHIYTL